jgi:EmrB/QacA subfamily drug resistance transporter
MEANTEASSINKWLCFLAVALGTFVAYSDSSMINIALPRLAGHFHVDMSVVEAIITCYLLMLTGLVVIFGRVADMYGRKKLYILGFAIFTIASSLCGLAPSLWLLILGRAVQGVGAALLLANGTAIVTAIFPAAERGKALGALGSVIAFAVIIGPPIAGFLADRIGWRSVFYVNFPIGIVGLILASRVLPAPSEDVGKERFDVAGAVSFVAFLSAFLLALKVLSRPEFHPALFSALAAAAVFLGGLFIVIESRTEHPLIDLSLFQRRLFGAAAASSFLSFWALSAVTFLLPFYLVRVLHLSSTQSGYLLAPIAAMLVFSAPLGGRLADRFGTRAICTLGASINCLGLLYLSTLDSDTTQLGVVLRMVPLGLGSGLFQPPNNSSIMGTVPNNRLGIASGMISAIKNFGSMSGVAVTSVLFTALQTGALERMRAGGGTAAIVEQQAFVFGVRVVFLISAAILSVAVLASFVRGEEAIKQESRAAAKV